VLDERGRQTAKEIESAGGQALYVSLDVTQEASWAAAMDTTIKKFGKLDVLLNNAGIFNGKGRRGRHARRVEPAGRRQPDRRCAGHASRPAHLKASGAASEHGSAIVNLASSPGSSAPSSTRSIR